jgi:hypothetical protein
MNWRSVGIGVPIRDLVTAPMLFINIFGRIDWDEAAWKKIRDYCFSGGVVVFNLNENAGGQRASLEQGLKIAFPEYKFASIEPNDPILKVKHDLKRPGDVRAIGNGLKNFAYIAPEDWSCHLNLNRVEDAAATFEFFDSLLEYTRDGERPWDAFEPSNWDMGGGAVLDVRVARMEVGGQVPAYPDLIRTLDRMMQSAYRLKVEQVPPDASTRPAMLWLSVAGSRPFEDRQREIIRRQIERGTFLFAEVLTGNPDWVEAFVAELQRVGSGISVKSTMLATHPVLTGYVAGTQGYDVRRPRLRRAAREEDTERPRAGMYLIEKDGRQIGVLSTYDIASGIGYVMYPACRGPMPVDSRKLITNILLYAMERMPREAK